MRNPYRNQRSRTRQASSLSTNLLPLSMLCALMPAVGLGQIRANVSVDLTKGINVLTDTSLSIPTPTFDANSFNQAGVPYLRAAGVTAAHYPGNHGVADVYHWSTNTLTAYKGAEPAYFAPEASFGSFAQLAEKLGQASVVVNYGSNKAGTGGGEPAEAAAWVAYANGDAQDTRALGKDSKGEDWKTVGYWATLRGQDPLSDDDGLNFLRIHHAKPFAVKLWQIGDAVYNNGYYGGEHTGTPDLHGAVPTGPKDITKLKGNAKLSPLAYGENLNAFALAMKAVDASIQIGAPLTTPPDGDKWAASWNSDVLKSACQSIDYVALEWSSGPVMPPDWKVLNEAELLSSTTADIGGIINSLLDGYKRLCPKGHVPRIAFSPAAIATWPKIEHPVVSTLWLANTYALLIESGSININWSETYGDTMLSADRKKLGPAFYGLQLLHILVHAPGDTLLEASSNVPQVSAHASKRRDGYVGLMLINKDPKTAAAVKITWKGGAIGTTGKRFDYGLTESTSGAAMSQSAFTATPGEFTVTVPPYTVTDIVLPGHP